MRRALPLVSVCAPPETVDYACSGARSGPRDHGEWQLHLDMNNEFFERPTRKSPYEYPARHWELEYAGQPSGRIVDERREASFLAPIPSAKGHSAQKVLGFDVAPRTCTATWVGLSTATEKGTATERK